MPLLPFSKPGTLGRPILPHPQIFKLSIQTYECFNFGSYAQSPYPIPAYSFKINYSPSATGLPFSE